MDRLKFRLARRHRIGIGCLWLALAIGGTATPAAHADSSPAEDRLACAQGMPARAAAALDYPVDAGFWDDEWHTACRLDPAHPGRAIVALTYRKGEERTGEAADGRRDDDASYDLDVVVMNVADDTIVAHRHEPDAIMSDAIRYEGLRIDTARYQLAPGRRAFGIRMTHNSHCYQCAYGYTDLALYLQDGSRIDALLAIQVAETTNAFEDECPDAITESTTTVGVGPRRSHGLADLLLTTTVKGDAYAEAGSSSTCATEQSTTVTAHFDGRAYRLPTAGASRP
jgi:hypothetical protein